MRLKSIIRTLPNALAALVVLAACSGTSTSSGSNAPTDVRLGYFPNITHATALVGVANGTYAQQLGSLGKLRTQTFNAGPAVVEAVFSGALDIAYVGPNPAVNAPWASRLVLEGGGKVLVDERSLWPHGDFVTTLLIVRKQFLDNHPAQVKAILRAHVQTTTYLNAHPAETEAGAVQVNT